MRISDRGKHVSGKKASIRYSVRDILDEVPDLEEMDCVALQEYRAQLEEAKLRLDLAEPANERSDAYEEWAEEHEDLEDLIDEVDDLLDEIA